MCSYLQQAINRQKPKRNHSQGAGHQALQEGEGPGATEGPCDSPRLLLGSVPRPWRLPETRLDLRRRAEEARRGGRQAGEGSCPRPRAGRGSL